MNPFRELVEQYDRLLREGASWRVEAPAEPPPMLLPANDADRPVLIFAPHPDDECLMGALALRLLRQRWMRVLVVPVTLGSQLERRAERLCELQAACAWLGFEMVPTGPSGLGAVTPSVRQDDAMSWADVVRAAARILTDHRPAILFVPHAQDQHPAHAGTHLLVRDALAAQAADFRCWLFETEYWAPMANPNLMVASSIDDVADLVAALSLHRGEVARSPYHLRLPAWMVDNVRRGAELLGGFRAEAPPCPFATLYRCSLWCNGALRPPPTSATYLPDDVLPAHGDPTLPRSGLADS